jgi:hypothetical protein
MTEGKAKYLGVSGREVIGDWEHGEDMYKKLVGGIISECDMNNFTVKKGNKIYECSVDADCYSEIKIFRIDKIIKPGRD